MSVLRTAVIIAAAGASRRMGDGLPKQYRMCENLPVLVKAVKAFCACGDVFEIVAAVPKGDKDYVSDLLSRYGVDGVKLAEGGDIRQISTANALKLVDPSCEFVLVHDAARPFVSSAVIDRVINALKEGAEAVIPCVAPKNTIRTAELTLDRSKLYEVQTPQGFKKETLEKALRTAAQENFIGTDEAGLTEHIGIKTVITEGDYKNIKLTTPEDFPVNIRTGFGYDVHKLVEGRPLMLGCVQVPYQKGLLGHSDADVIAHAIADALLGAAALGDIGKHFPDTDPAYEGMSGREILSRTAAIIRNAGFTIINVDATLAAQRPKISSYTEEMRKAAAEALGIDPMQIGIKATTEEGLGITGSGEAMAAYAAASIK